MQHQELIHDTCTIDATPPLRRIEIYPPHLLAQKLNNRAGYLITTGDYDGSIALLTKALKLTEENVAADKSMQACCCKYCGLESILGMSTDSRVSILESEKEDCTGVTADDFQQSACHACERDEDMNYSLGEDFNSFGLHGHPQKSYPASPSAFEERVGFVYDRPFLVNKNSIEEGHFMGITLSLIILVNLALAHHLKAVSSSYANSKSILLSSSNMQVLRQALQLYEIAYQLHNDYIQKPTKTLSTAQPEDCNRNIGSLRFTMILSNNLGEIHRIAGNAIKHKMCLEHLLSAIMYMVDCNIIIMNSAEMDGFYHNVIPIMLTDNCAKAA